MHKIVAFSLAIALFSGCASADSVRNAPESKGKEQVFNVGYSGIVETVATTLPAIGLENIDRQSNDSQTTVFLGTVGVTPQSWGEIVRVTVTNIDVDTSSVKVYWRHKFRDGPISFAPDWSDKVFTGIEERLP